ncbi:WD40 repeat-like protein [Linnemannia elongata AG-77]|uniref:WD40 repeat-like protein n=1 Tax=Linnemannia elongata AG-77 TaxID=1314771 RepID=A0A197JGX1_9FUNG|nr:WD40 repeat-like protein [Linnemannia elongata AG-77]
MRTELVLALPQASPNSANQFWLATCFAITNGRAELSDLKASSRESPSSGFLTRKRNPSLAEAIRPGSMTHAVHYSLNCEEEACELPAVQLLFALRRRTEHEDGLEHKQAQNLRLKPVPQLHLSDGYEPLGVTGVLHVQHELKSLENLESFFISPTTVSLRKRVAHFRSFEPLQWEEVQGLAQLTLERLDRRLGGVNLTKSWIRQADFTKAQMERVQFEEMPYLKENKWVDSCAYSPDGVFLAVGLIDGRINTYDTSIWTMTVTYGGHQEEVISLAYSPTGHQLLSGSEDKTVRLWDCESGSCILVLKGHTGGVRTVAFSPCGKQVASAGMDKTVRLWDVQTGTNQFTLTGHTGWIRGISYSPDGLAIVSVGTERMIQFFDTRTGQPGEVWESQNGKMRSIIYSPGALEIAVGYENGELQFYNTTTGKPTRNWKAHDDAVAGVSFSPNGQWTVTCSWDNTVKVWSAVTGSVLSVFTGHSDSVRQVAFSPNGLQLASCSFDCTIRLWDVSSLGAGMDVESESDPLMSILFSPDGRVLVCAAYSGVVRQFDAISGESGPAIVCGYRPVNCIAISPDGLRIASALTRTCFGDIYIRDMGTGQAEIVQQFSSREVNAIAFSADSRWIATGGDDKIVRLRDARSRILKRELEGHASSVTSLVFSPNSHRIFSGSRDGTIRAWDLESGRCRVVVDAAGFTERWVISASSNGLRVASKGLLGAVDIWDAESGQLQQSLEHRETFYSSAFSSCGQWLGVGLTGSVWLWIFASNKTAEGGEGRGEWKCLVRIRDIFGRVLSMAWKPNTLDFGIGCANGSLQVWRLVETSTPSSEAWSTQMVWGAGNPVLVASDAIFVDAVGLSSVNQKLLTQRSKDAVA